MSVCSSCRARPVRARLTILLAGTTPDELCRAACLERALDAAGRSVNVLLEYVNGAAPLVNAEPEEAPEAIALPLDHATQEENEAQEEEAELERERAERAARKRRASTPPLTPAAKVYDARPRFNLWPDAE